MIHNLFSKFGSSVCKEHSERNEMMFTGVQSSTAWLSDADSMREALVTLIAVRRVCVAILIPMLVVFSGVCVRSLQKWSAYAGSCHKNTTGFPILSTVALANSHIDSHFTYLGVR